MQSLCSTKCPIIGIAQTSKPLHLCSQKMDVVAASNTSYGI